MVTEHHVPPRLYQESETFKIRVPWFKHRAYHKLLGTPPSFEKARRVLVDRHHDYEQGQLPGPLVQYFRLLFSGARTLEEREQRLLEEWWTRGGARRQTGSYAQ